MPQQWNPNDDYEVMEESDPNATYEIVEDEPIKPDFTSQAFGELGQVSQDEPDTWWGGVANSLNPFGGGEALSAGWEGLKGFAKGATLDIPSSLYDMAANTAGFAGDVLSDPIGYSGKVAGALGDLPAVTKGIGIGARNVGDSMLYAGSQPEEFGRTMGQLTGQPAVTAGIAPHLPAPSSVVGAAGRPVAAFGELASRKGAFGSVTPGPIAYRWGMPEIVKSADRALGRGIESVGNRMRSYGATPPPVIPPPNPTIPGATATPTGFTNFPVRPTPPPVIPPSRQLNPSSVFSYQGPSGSSGPASSGTTPPSKPPTPTPNSTAPPNPVPSTPTSPPTSAPFVDDVLGKFKKGGLTKTKTKLTPEQLAEVKKQRSAAMDAKAKGYRGTIDEQGNVTPKKNDSLVDKVKKLAKDESGEFDPDAVRSIIDRMSPLNLLEAIRHYSNRARYGRQYDELIEYAAARMPQNRGPLPDDIQNILNDVRAAREIPRLPEHMRTAEAIPEDSTANVTRREYTPEEIEILRADEGNVEYGLSDTYASNEPVRVTPAIMDALDRIPEQHINTFIEHYRDEYAFGNTRADMASYLEGRMNEINRRLGRPDSYRPGQAREEFILQQQNQQATLDQPEQWHDVGGNRVEEPINTYLEEARIRRKTQSEAALDKAEAKKKTPASERLKKIVGEDVAKQLTSGEKVIEYDEPAYRNRGKRVPQYTQNSWNEWARGQLRGEKADPSKPGLNIGPQDNYFKDMLNITYRDKNGKPIGVLKTDLSGKGISTLAVDPELGLRRGKVAFEMLKEAFDRGITEPSGITSDFTKNLIERVKRLARNDKGEFDMDAFNDLIEELSNMEMPSDEFAASVMSTSGTANNDRREK